MRFKDSIDTAFATSFLQVLYVKIYVTDPGCISEIAYMWAMDN
jgi:hypothetical protein